MKALVLYAVIFLSLFVSLSHQDVWSSLGSTDAERLATTTRVVDRLFGVVGGDYCVGHYFYNHDENYYKQMLAFLCTWFGGNPSKLAAQDRIPQCQYRMEGDSGYPIIYSEQTADLLNSLLFTHADLYISVEEHAHFKSMMISVMESLKIDTTEIKGMLDLTDNSIIYEDAFSRSCPEVTNITWINLVITSHTNVIGDTVCWVWNDNDTHSVLPTSDITFTGYGSGKASLNTSALCSEMPDTDEPCYLSSPLQYCHRFEKEGEFRFVDTNNEHTAIALLGIIPPPPPPQSSESSSSTENGSDSQTGSNSDSTSHGDSNLPIPSSEDLVIDYSPDDSDAASTLVSFLFLF